MGGSLCNLAIWRGWKENLTPANSPPGQRAGNRPRASGGPCGAAAGFGGGGPPVRCFPCSPPSAQGRATVTTQVCRPSAQSKPPWSGEVGLLVCDVLPLMGGREGSALGSKPYVLGANVTPNGPTATARRRLGAEAQPSGHVEVAVPFPGPWVHGSRMSSARAPAEPCFQWDEHRCPHLASR